MQRPPLVPPTELPFAVHHHEAQVVITVDQDASHHHGMAELRAIAWVRGIAVPVVVDLAQVQLLSSALIGWMFGMLHEGKLRRLLIRLLIRHANRRVQAQMQQVGLNRFVSFQAADPAGAQVPA